MFNSRALIGSFFCLIFFIVFTNSVNAAQSIQAKNVKIVESFVNFFEKENYIEAAKLLDKFESRKDLNNMEKATLYNFRCNLAIVKDDYKTCHSWLKKVALLDMGAIPESTLSHTKEMLEVTTAKILHLPNYEKHQHLLKELDTTKKITDQHFTLAEAALELSKKADAQLILKKVKSLHEGQTALPEKWMKLEVSLAENSDKKLELEKKIVNHYPSKSNRNSLSRSLYKKAFTAFEESDLTKSRSILKQAEDLHQSDEPLPERWMYFKARINKGSKEELGLWQQLAKHYPNTSNQRNLAACYSRNNREQEAYAIYIKLYNLGKLFTEKELQFASYSFYKSGDNLKGALVLAKGFKEKSIFKFEDNLDSYNVYFSDAKKDKTITAQGWLDAGDKFVLYGDKDKAKVCFKKAKKDKALRDIAKQRLKELKQS